jgi:hypothetical protein
MLVESRTRQSRSLVVIKIVHTAVWAFFASCIVLIPVAAQLHRFGLAVILSAATAVECLVLAFNQCRCPLTDLAGKHTDERAANFDIYLPLWVARYNKIIFGVLFVVGEIILLVRWLEVTR